jgi:peptide/nickel transport system ATP-binding protein
MKRPLLELVQLKSYYQLGNTTCRAVDGVSFSIQEGRNLGLVGESGCGKSTVVKSIIKVFPRNFRIQEGKILFKGRDLTPLDYQEMRKVRWKEISVIPQSAMNALNPVYKVGYQIREAILEHERVGRKEASERVRSLFEVVGIDPGRADEYPHQFSGGMRQRANIALALALKPSLIIADEPTTALDVIVQDQIFYRIGMIQKQIGCSMMLVTHDISLVAENCHQMVVMYAGKVMEYSDVAKILKTPCHPYTMGLKNAFPDVNRSRNEPLISIPKSPPSLVDPPTHCRFYSRCPFGTPICQEQEPKMSEVAEGHFAACHHWRKAEDLRKRSKRSETWEAFA